MNAIEQLYINAGFVTEDGYIKVNDKLWVKSEPYEKKSWLNADKSILPTKEELNEIHLKFQELILIQEACGLDSLRKILGTYPWAWSSTECSAVIAWGQRMGDGSQDSGGKSYGLWIVPVRRF